LLAGYTLARFGWSPKSEMQNMPLVTVGELRVRQTGEMGK